MTNIKRNIGIGPALAAAKVGQTFTTSASDTWEVGEELETWSRLRVRITGREESGSPTSWRYRYTAEIVALPTRGEGY